MSRVHELLIWLLTRGNMANRFSPFVYTAQGKIVSERLWEETMREFDFIDARGLLESMQKV